MYVPSVCPARPVDVPEATAWRKENPAALPRGQAAGRKQRRGRASLPGSSSLTAKPILPRRAGGPRQGRPRKLPRLDGRALDRPSMGSALPRTAARPAPERAHAGRSAIPATGLGDRRSMAPVHSPRGTGRGGTTDPRWNDSLGKEREADHRPWAVRLHTPGVGAAQGVDRLVELRQEPGAVLRRHRRRPAGHNPALS